MTAIADWRAGNPPYKGDHQYWLALFQPKTGMGWIESWTQPNPTYRHPDLVVVIGPVVSARIFGMQEAESVKQHHIRRHRRTAKQTLKHGKGAKRRHTRPAGRSGSIRSKQGSRS